MPKIKQKTKKFFYSPKFIALLGLIILILIGFPLAKNISKRYAVDQEIKELELEIKSLESQNKDMKNFIGYLESDQFLEEQARLKFGLKKPGEEVVVIKEDLISSLNQTDESATEADISNQKRWFTYFFKH